MNRRKHLSLALFALMAMATANVQAQDMVTTYEGELGHTVAIDVASFTDVRDKTLEDVLGKMPGIDSDDYGLTYNQMSIDKIYVNGSDTWSSFKVVAGIKPEEVEKVEFIENFQPVEVLRGKQYSASVAMNIILKSDGSKWSGTARGGIGASPFTYDGDLYAIRLSDKGTNMFNVKANNTGEDLSGSISSFQTNDIGIEVNYFSLSDYISIDPTTTDINTKRTRFNDSFMFNTVNTFKLGNKYQLYTQLSYLFDKYHTESTTTTSYFMQDGSAVNDITNEYASRRNHQAKTNIALISNNDKYYLVNHIYANGSWQDIDMNLTGTYPNNQAGKLTSITAKDDFRFLMPIGNWNLTVFSQNQFSAIPQKINIAREGSAQHQDISSHAFFSDTKVSFGYTKNKWTVSLIGGFDALSRSLNTELTGVSVPEEPDFRTTDNDSRFTFLEGFVQPTANFVSDRFQMMIGMPVKYYHYNFKEWMTGEKSSKNITNFEPTFSLKYKFSDNFSMRLEGNKEYDQVNAGNFYTGNILTNYRYIRYGALNYDLDNTSTIELGYDYKLPSASLFVGGQVGYSDGKSKYRTTDRFIGDFVLRGTTPQDSKTKYTYGHVSATKGISALKGNVGLWVGVTNTDMEMIRNNANVKYNTKVLSVKPSINGRLTSWMKVEYELETYTTWMKVADTKYKSNRYNHNLEVLLNPTDKLNFSLYGKHYHADGSGMKSQDLFLADAKVEYQITKSLQAIVYVTNLLNQRDYTYTGISSDDLTSTHLSYKLRGRNVLASLYYKF